MAEDLVRTFDVEADCPRFATYVNELRYELRDRDRPAPLFDGLYTLRPYTDAPEQWLRLTMAYSGAAIELMIRMDNLYLVGFRQQGPGGRTWEFGTTTGQSQGERWQELINGSQPLGFGGGYTGRGLGDIPTAPVRGEQATPDVGLQRLIAAIQGLATYRGGQGSDAAKRWLRTIIVIIIESIRSQRVCAYVASLMRPGRSDDWPTSGLVCLIKNWEKISECVVLSASNPDIPGLYRYLREKGICGNTYEARQVVAILYRGPAPAPAPHRGRRDKRSAAAAVLVDDDEGDVLVPPGLTLVEVFAVVMLDIDCAGRGELCGSIAIDDGLGPEVLFRRNRSEAQSVRLGGLADLAGPKRAIWGYDEVVLDLDLTHASRCPDTSPDLQIGKGQMVWNAHQRPVEDYDKVQEHVLVGDHGAVKVRYAVVTNAVVATVAVELVLTHGGSSYYADVYGSITAATSAFSAGSADKETTATIKLFDRDAKHAVTVTADGQSIRLLRNVLVVQLGSSLQINAEIWDTAFEADMAPPDYQIAKGVAEFDATLDAGTTASRTITGAHGGEATVRVTWSRT